MRRETIAMLRKKRQQVAAEKADSDAEEIVEEPSQARRPSKSPPPLSPSPEFDFDDQMSEASSATTRSVHSEPELTHNQQVLKAQRERLDSMMKKSLKNTAARVQHEKDTQREEDELGQFVAKKMQRMDDLAAGKVREQKERMRIAGEREREKLLRLMVMEEEERARAARDKEVRIQKMKESEAKREAATKERREAIAEENAARRAEAEVR